MTEDRAAPQPSHATRFDGIDLEALARAVGTPCHVYSANAIRTRVDELQLALTGLDATICYAVKANSNGAILALMAARGVGADIVSHGELWRALRAGIPANRIVFSGVGKTEEEIEAALSAGIARFNVESADELHALERIAASRRVLAHAAVRVNPDVDALTHAKISTGKAENKFGVSIGEARAWFADATRFPHVRLDGLHVHIGSQILDLEPFRVALARVAALARDLGDRVTSIDVGGGLGVAYRSGERSIEPRAYAAVLRETLGDFAGRIVLEPGRYLIADAGLLLTRVIRTKEGAERRFLVLDAAMNDLQRPSLYDAWHEIAPVTDRRRAPVRYDVVGPICETGDTFARDREMPECRAGELVMIRTTGAYGASMASTYNSRPLSAEVLVDDGRYAVVRKRQTMHELVMDETSPTNWQRL